MVQPAIRFRVGACSASVFYNESGGDKPSFARVSLQRVYKDRAGAYQYTTGLAVRDLPNAILALWQAWTHLALELREPGAE